MLVVNPRTPAKVPTEVAMDVVAHQSNAGAEHEFDLGVFPEDFDETGDLLQRGREVGIPEADKAGALCEGGE